MTGPGQAIPALNSGHSPVLGRERALELSALGVFEARKAGADEAEVLIMTEDSGLARYAKSRIHQHVNERNAEVRIRTARGSRIAVVTGNQTTGEAVRKLAERAASMAAQSPEDPHFPGLPGPSDLTYVDQTTYYESTASVDADHRGATVALTVDLLRQAGAVGYGVVTSAVTETAIANSAGVHRYQAYTDSWISVIAQRPLAGDPSARPATGYATSCHRDWTEVDAESAALHALAKASTDPPRQIPPGEYTVLLEEEAVAELLLFLGYTSINGLEYVEGRSLYSGRMGERRYPEWITLQDDPTDPRGANVSFDFEGVAKAPLTLIRDGALEHVAFDSSTSHRAREENTAHALPAPNPYGPMPLNMVLQPGNATRSELLGRMERGLLVTRFHYVNDVDPARTLLTGMTRDGTFLVEDGRIVAPVQDLRWVESIDGVLTRSLAVGDSPKLVTSGPTYGIRFFVGTLAPCLLTEGFTITGSAAD
jgi:PmbA protein